MTHDSPPVQTAAPAFEAGPEYLQSLARGLSVIRAFGPDRAELTQAELAQRTGLSRAVVRRCLLTLEHLGYVGARDRRYVLLPRVLELGFGYLSSLQLPELALPAMEALSQTVHESCSLAVLDDEDVVYVARVPVRRVISVNLAVGARVPAFAASLGRVLLADLAEVDLDRWLARAQLRALTPHTLCTPAELRAEIGRVRSQGHSLVLRELELALCALAVPVRDRQGRTVAALNVGMQYRADIRGAALATILPALQQAAAQIERALAAVWTAAPSLP
jgi:IclR family transcriptional regulator, pca regulon regulatory protein